MKKNNSIDLRNQVEMIGLVVPGICKVTVRNETPQSWKATIISVGTNFHNRDGSKFTDGPYQVNVGSGGETYMQSNDPNQCVHHVETYLQVVIPGQKPATFGAADNAPADACLCDVIFTLKPKSSVGIKDHKTKDFSKFIELK